MDVASVYGSDDIEAGIAVEAMAAPDAACEAFEACGADAEVDASFEVEPASFESPL
jgi:hypothetical protein